MIVLKRFVRLRVKMPTRANVYTVSRLVLILVRTLGSCFLFFVHKGSVSWFYIAEFNNKKKNPRNQIFHWIISTNSNRRQVFENSISAKYRTR